MAEQDSKLHSLSLDSVYPEKERILDKIKNSKINLYEEMLQSQRSSEDLIRIHYQMPSQGKFEKTLLNDGSEFRTFLGEVDPIYLQGIDDMVANLVKLFYNNSISRPKLPLKNVIELFSNPYTKKAILKDLPQLKHVIDFIFSRSFAEVIDTAKSSLIDIFIENIYLLDDQDLATSCWNRFIESMKMNSKQPDYWNNMHLVVIPRCHNSIPIWKIVFSTSNKGSYKESYRDLDKFICNVLPRFMIGYFGMDLAPYMKLAYDYDDQSDDRQLPKLLFDNKPTSKKYEIIKHTNNKAGILQINQWVDRIIQNPYKKKNIRLYGNSQFDSDNLVAYALSDLQKSMPRLKVKCTKISELKSEFERSIASMRNETDSTKKWQSLNIFESGIADCDVLILEGFDDVINQHGIIKRLEKNFPNMHILLVSSATPIRVIKELENNITSLPEKRSYVADDGKFTPTIFREQYVEFINTLQDGFDKTHVGAAPIAVNNRILDAIVLKELGIFGLPDEVKTLITGFVKSISSYENIVRQMAREEDRRSNEDKSVNEDMVVTILQEILTLEVDINLSLARKWFNDYIGLLEVDDRYYPSLEEQDRLFVYLMYYTTKPSFNHFQQKWTRLEISNSVGKKGTSFVSDVISMPSKSLKRHPFSSYYQKRQDFFYKRVVSYVKGQNSVQSSMF